MAWQVMGSGDVLLYEHEDEHRVRVAYDAFLREMQLYGHVIRDDGGWQITLIGLPLRLLHEGAVVAEYGNPPDSSQS